MPEQISCQHETSILGDVHRGKQKSLLVLRTVATVWIQLDPKHLTSFTSQSLPLIGQVKATIPEAS